MEQTGRIPEAVIRRLPRYYRYLEELERRGEIRISSSKMSEEIGFNASQIRRDLNCFGGFGQQGYGYSVDKLKREIAHILGLDRQYNMVLAGAGNIGQALLRYANFAERGYNIVGIFDVAPGLIGTVMDGVPILPMGELERFVKEKNVDIGVICTPMEAAQEVASRMARAGIRGIWNFAPIDVRVGEKVAVENVHLNDGLYVLSFRMGTQL